MHNNVVEALATGAAEAGWGSLRFNFRGVGGSGGSHEGGLGERQDAIAAVAWARQQHPGPVVIAGYSFGAMVGSAAAASMLPLAGGLWVSPPLLLGPLAPWPPAAGRLVILAGARDNFTSVEQLNRYAHSLGERAQVQIFPEQDHFWWGAEEALATEIYRFLLMIPRSIHKRT